MFRRIMGYAVGYPTMGLCIFLLCACCYAGKLAEALHALKNQGAKISAKK